MSQRWKVDFRGKLKKLPWGEQVTGTLVLECAECEGIRKMRVENSTICEGIGERCPVCERITTNWVLDLLPLSTIEDWF